MIEPEVTAVQGRRYLALLLDSALVAATGLGVAYLQSEALPIVGRDSDTNEALIDPAQFDRFESLVDFELFGQSEILGVPVVRAQEIGDSMRIFGQDSYVWGLTTAVVVAIVVFFVVPALIQRTLGMVPFGLRILAVDGGPASVGAHVKRSIVGVVDMIPIIVPGLVGALVAGSSSRHQRIGDLVAETVVVDAQLAAFRTSGGSTVDGTGMSRPTLDLIPDNGSDDTRDLSGLTLPAVADTPAITSSPADNRLESVLSVGATAPPAEAAIPTPDATEPAPAAPEVTPTAFDEAPLPPPPVHRQAPADIPRPTDLDQPLRFADSDAVDSQPLASLVGATADDGADGMSVDDRVAVDDDAGIVAVSDAWEAPRVEPAPVWQPASFDPAPAEEPDPDDDRPLDEVVLGGPSVGELISTSPVTDGITTGADTSADRQDEQSATARTRTAKTPVWSDKWRAWMYWDGDEKCWLRHDTATNTWIRVD